MRAFAADRLALAGAAALALLVAGALLAPWIAPQDPYDLARFQRVGDPSHGIARDLAQGCAAAAFGPEAPPVGGPGERRCAH